MGEIAIVAAEGARLAVMRRLWAHLRDGRVSLIAAGCAFYATLALFPGMSMLVSAYGLVFDPVTVVPQLNVLRDVLPPEAYTLIGRRLHALVTQPHMTLRWGVVVSALVTLWSASNGTKSLLAAIDHTHGGGFRSMLRFQAIGLAMTLSATLAAVMAIAILVALPHALQWLGLPRMMRGVVHTASLGVLVLFVLGSIAALYRFGPVKHGQGRPLVIPGAVLATLLWIAASVAFSYYVGKLAGFDATYGPLGAVAGVMLWFWVSTYVVLLGAGLNAALDVSESAP
jgi:membrane protein